MDKLTLVEAELEVLRNENYALRLKIDELKTLLKPIYIFPTEWDLPRREADVLALLATHKGYLTRERWASICLGPDELINERVFETHYSKLVRKCREMALPIEFNSKRFLGYWISDDSKRYLEQFKRD